MDNLNLYLSLKAYDSSNNYRHPVVYNNKKNSSIDLTNSDYMYPKIKLSFSSISKNEFDLFTPNKNPEELFNKINDINICESSIKNAALINNLKKDQSNTKNIAITTQESSIKNTALTNKNLHVESNNKNNAINIGDSPIKNKALTNNNLHEESKKNNIEINAGEMSIKNTALINNYKTEELNTKNIEINAGEISSKNTALINNYKTEELSTKNVEINAGEMSSKNTATSQKEILVKIPSFIENDLILQSKISTTQLINQPKLINSENKFKENPIVLIIEENKFSELDQQKELLDSDDKCKQYLI